jgi:hypothetical protein
MYSLMNVSHLQSGYSAKPGTSKPTAKAKEKKSDEAESDEKPSKMEEKKTSDESKREKFAARVIKKSKSKLHLSNIFHKRKSKSNVDFASTTSDVDWSSTVTRKLPGSWDSYLTITSDASQVLSPSETNLPRSISSGVDRSQETASSEHRGETTNLDDTVHTYETTPNQSNDASGIVRADWDPEAHPLEEHSLTPVGTHFSLPPCDSPFVTITEPISEPEFEEIGEPSATQIIDRAIQKHKGNTAVEADLTLVKMTVEPLQVNIAAAWKLVKEKGELKDGVAEFLVENSKLMNQVKQKQDLLDFDTTSKALLEEENKLLKEELMASKELVDDQDRRISSAQRNIHEDQVRFCKTYELIGKRKQDWVERASENIRAMSDRIREMHEHIQGLEMELITEKMHKEDERDAKEAAFFELEEMKKECAFYQEFFENHLNGRESTVSYSQVHDAQGITMRPSSGEAKQIELRQGVISRSCSSERVDASTAVRTE